MNTKLLTAMSIALAMAACASTPQPNAALESARAAVQSAQADPNAAKYAALDLQAAKTDLATADAAALKHDEAGIAQPAYMAAQSARLAQLRGAAKADDARVAAGQAERDSIVLAARTNQVDSANRAADLAKAGRDDANNNSARLQAEVDALKAKPTDRGLVLTLGDVLFETGSSTLSPGAGRNLDRLVQFLTEHPDRLVQIDGFTDSVGTDSFNLDLSQRRADAVRADLLRRGVGSARVATQGYGKDYPVASNAESGGRQLNRRVEVVIGADNGAAIAARRS
jgi:outer membrane protein OmpA-like peptidoglycan-associated protein